MNTSILSKIAGLGLLASSLFASSALATDSAPACTGATTLAVHAMRPQLPNGRGAMVRVQTGTKTVCHTCPVVAVVRTNAWANGRGPTKTTTVAQTGVEHTCTSCSTTAEF